MGTPFTFIVGCAGCSQRQGREGSPLGGAGLSCISLSINLLERGERK